MSMWLTGRTKLQRVKRWFRAPIFVLKVEYIVHGDDRNYFARHVWLDANDLAMDSLQPTVTSYFKTDKETWSYLRKQNPNDFAMREAELIKYNNWEVERRREVEAELRKVQLALDEAEKKLRERT